MTSIRSLQSYWLPLLLFIVVVTRIPLLLSGYSSDPDAWRVANVGKAFWETGIYTASRFPGYPLHELITGAFVILGGSFLSNSATLVVALLLLLAWYKFVRHTTNSPKLLVVLLAFTPLFWINSVATLDYVWSLLFVVLSLVAIRERNALLGGIWLGCAIGFRPTNAVAIAPLLTFIYCTRMPRVAYLGFIGTAIVTSLAALSPVWLTYGFIGWFQQTLYQAERTGLSSTSHAMFFLYRLIYSIGPLAILSAVTTLIVNHRRLGEFLTRREPYFLTSLVGVIAFIMLLAFFPLDRSYVLPMVPFLYLLVDRVATRATMVFAGCVLSFAFINPDIVVHSRTVGNPGPNVHAGIVIEEWQKRNHLLDERIKIASQPIAGKGVIMTGTSESFWFENALVEIDTAGQWKRFDDDVVHNRKNPDLHFVSGMSRDKTRSLQHEGYTVYCLKWTAEFIKDIYGYSPEEEGVVVMEP